MSSVSRRTLGDEEGDGVSVGSPGGGHSPLPSLGTQRVTRERAPAWYLPWPGLDAGDCGSSGSWPPECSSSSWGSAPPSAMGASVRVHQPPGTSLGPWDPCPARRGPGEGTHGGPPAPVLLPAPFPPNPRALPHRPPCPLTPPSSVPPPVSPSPMSCPHFPCPQCPQIPVPPFSQPLVLCHHPPSFSPRPKHPVPTFPVPSVPKSLPPPRPQCPPSVPPTPVPRPHGVSPVPSRPIPVPAPGDTVPLRAPPCACLQP